MVGILTLSLAIAMSKMKDTLLGILFTTTTNLGAPFFGTALCGMFLPFVNRKGVLAGMIAPVIPISLWFLQQIIQPIGSQKSKMITDRNQNCQNISEITSFGCQDHCMNFTQTEETPKSLQLVLNQSPYVFGMMGLFMFFLICIPVSYLTKNDSKIPDKKLTVYYEEPRSNMDSDSLLYLKKENHSILES